MLCMPTEKIMYVPDTDASVVVIPGILHQEQEWNGISEFCKPSKSILDSGGKRLRRN